MIYKKISKILICKFRKKSKKTIRVGKKNIMNYCKKKVSKHQNEEFNNTPQGLSLIQVHNETGLVDLT